MDMGWNALKINTRDLNKFHVAKQRHLITENTSTKENGDACPKSFGFTRDELHQWTAVQPKVGDQPMNCCSNMNSTL